MGPLNTTPVDAAGRVRGRTLVVIGGGIEAVPGIRRAKQLGLRVVVTDAADGCPGRAEADAFLRASTYDPMGTVAAIRASGERVDGAICIATDVPLTVATVASELGLPGLPLDVATAAADKLDMKRRLGDGGVPVPWFSPVGDEDHLDAVRSLSPGPLILKPVDSRGARGVIRLLPDVGTRWAFAEARRHSPTGRVMVERFLVGPQVSTESLVVGGSVHTVGLADRNYEHLDRFAPFVVEDGGELPADLDPSLEADVRAVVERAATALGIDDGVMKGDVVVHEGVPHIIEVAARLSGGYFCTHEIPISTGVDLVGAAILVALGETPDDDALSPTRQRHVAQRYLLPQPGRVVRITGTEEVLARPGIELCEVRVRVGDTVAATDSHPARAGLVITSGADRAEARARAVAAVGSIRIETVGPD